MMWFRALMIMWMSIWLGWAMKTVHGDLDALTRHSLAMNLHIFHVDLFS